MSVLVNTMVGSKDKVGQHSSHGPSNSSNVDSDTMKTDFARHNWPSSPHQGSFFGWFLLFFAIVGVLGIVVYGANFVQNIKKNLFGNDGVAQEMVVEPIPATEMIPLTQFVHQESARVTPLTPSAAVKSGRVEANSKAEPKTGKSSNREAVDTAVRADAVVARQPEPAVVVTRDMDANSVADAKSAIKAGFTPEEMRVVDQDNLLDDEAPSRRSSQSAPKGAQENNTSKQKSRSSFVPTIVERDQNIDSDEEQGYVGGTEQGPEIIISRQLRKEAVHKMIAEANAHFLKGKTESAAKIYRKVMRQETFKREALMGLASIAVHNRQFNEARRTYQRILYRDPTDREAKARLISLREIDDPIRRASQLKTMIRKEPDNYQLHFILGTIYISQKQWSDARAAFQQAHLLEKDHPDTAYNLAVSLDHLRRPQEALRYYLLAKKLSKNHTAEFQVSQLDDRIKELNIFFEQ